MGNGESNPVRNMDKRTARREYKEDFAAAIDSYRRKVLGGPEDSAAGREGEGGGNSVRVCVRRRPIFKYELKDHEFDVLTCIGRGRIVVHDARMHVDMKRQFLHHHEFAFDNVFDQHATNQDVYEAAAKPLVTFATAGGYATCLMYGQTGSGKTHTMSAIYEYAAKDVFSLLESSPNAAVSVSFFELAGDSCSDMLNQFEPAQLLTGRDGSVHAFPLVEIRVQSAEDLVALINHGRAVRSTAATGVNDTSSRSHAILRIYVSRSESLGGPEEGVLTLVDLAGSEHRIDSMYHGAERRKEGAVINASLMALKECIRARASGKNFSHQYRKNKLTMALKSSFMLPTARTVIIATVSPASKDTEHSLNTLRHACIMDGQQSSAEDEETRFVTGGVKSVECIGEVNVSAISRQRRQDARQGLAAKNDAKVSNGNEARPDEKILSDTEKYRMRRAAEKKAFAKLSPEQKVLLRNSRNLIGRNPVQEARLSRYAAGDLEAVNECIATSGAGGGNEAVSVGGPPARAPARPLDFTEYSSGRTDRPTEQQNQRLIQMGLKNADESQAPRAGKVHNSPPPQSASARPLSPFRRSESAPPEPGPVGARLVSSPISRPGSAAAPTAEGADRAAEGERRVRMSRQRVAEFKSLQASMFAAEDVPFDVIKRQFVAALKQRGFRTSEIKALVIAQTGGDSIIIVADDSDAGEGAGAASSAVADRERAPAANSSEPSVFSIPKEKMNTFKKLKASVFSGADTGVSADILVRQLLALMKQRDFTRPEIAHLLRDLRPAPAPEPAACDSPPPSLRNSASAGSIRRATAKDAAAGADTAGAETGAARRKPTRLSKRSVLWRPSAADGSETEAAARPGPPEADAVRTPRSIRAEDAPVPYRPVGTEQESEISKLEKQIANPATSEATKFGLKKRLAAMKATLLRAERKVEQEQRERVRREQLDRAAPSRAPPEPAGCSEAFSAQPPASSYARVEAQARRDTGPVARIQMAPPQHVQSIKQPDMLDKYADHMLNRDPRGRPNSQQRRLGAGAQEKPSITPQHFSSPPSAYQGSERDTDEPERAAVGRRASAASYVGAVSAPFANEMNWNLYM